MERLKEGTIVRHYKGGLYRILGYGFQVENTDPTQKYHFVGFGQMEATLKEVFIYREMETDKFVIVSTELGEILQDELIVYLGIESQNMWVRTMEEWNAPVKDTHLKRFVEWNG